MWKDGPTSDNDGLMSPWQAENLGQNAEEIGGMSGEMVLPSIVIEGAK